MHTMHTLLTGILFVGLWCTSTNAQGPAARAGDQATVWYLRHAGYAVRLGEALLVFDYQEALGMEGVTADTPRALETGFIDPAEIKDLDVYVFVTHAHGDHYDPVIFEWQGSIENLTYFIGWEAEPESHCNQFVTTDANCHTMRGLRATAHLDDVDVYTIDSDHNDIPEVAYLVRIGDWTVYHNGDYVGEPVSDYAYLRTISDRIDFAFVSGLPGSEWPHLGRAVHLARQFDVPVLFAMHFRDRQMCEAFVAEVAAEGVTAEVTCPVRRGQRFVVQRSGGVGIRR